MATGLVDWHPAFLCVWGGWTIYIHHFSDSGEKVLFNTEEAHGAYLMELDGILMKLKSLSFCIC